MSAVLVRNFSVEEKCVFILSQKDKYTENELLTKLSEELKTPFEYQPNEVEFVKCLMKAIGDMNVVAVYKMAERKEQWVGKVISILESKNTPHYSMG